MYIINKVDLPNGRVQALQINGDKLELCTYPRYRVPKSEPCDFSEKFQLERYNNNFKLGDFAEGTIKGHKVYYTKCNPQIRSILTKGLGCHEGSGFRSI